MNHINISKKKLENLVPLDLSKKVFHTESMIYHLDYRGKDKVLKILYQSKGSIFANKLYTVEMLDCYKNYLPDSIKDEKLFSAF